MTKDKNNKDNNNSGAQAFSLGTELVSPIILGGLIGYWIDKSKHTGTKWTLILLVVGIVVGAYNFYKIVKKLNK